MQARHPISCVYAGTRRGGLLGQIRESCEDVPLMGVNVDSKIHQNRQGGGLDPVHRHQMTFTNIVMETTPPKPSFIARKIFRPVSLVRIARNRLSGAPTSPLLLEEGVKKRKILANGGSGSANLFLGPQASLPRA